MSKAKASQTNSGVTLSRMPALRHGLRALGQRAKRSVRRLYDVSRWLDRQQLAAIYLRGEGLEIGALHSPLKVPRAARVRYVDRLPVAELRRQYPELASAHLVDIDIVDDGEKLSAVGAGTQEFVIANHFLEHCEDPIGNSDLPRTHLPFEEVLIHRAAPPDPQRCSPRAHRHRRAAVRSRVLRLGRPSTGRSRRSPVVD